MRYDSDKLIKNSGSKHFLKEEIIRANFVNFAAIKSTSLQQRIMRYAREEDYNGAGIDIGRSNNMG